MSIFDKIFGNWIQIIDDKNDITIENYGYDTGIIEGTTKNHCIKCVSVNKCWFKDEENKKPEKFSSTNNELFNALTKGIVPGLYHFRCHCKEVAIEPSSPESIKLIIPEGKIQYLFTKKKDWVEAMGYSEEYDEFYTILCKKTKESYYYGKYYIENISNYGCKINIQVDMPGKNIKEGSLYKIESNYMVFPNGKLKLNTPIGGWQK